MGRWVRSRWDGWFRVFRTEERNIWVKLRIRIRRRCLDQILSERRCSTIQTVHRQNSSWQMSPFVHSWTIHIKTWFRFTKIQRRRRGSWTSSYCGRRGKLIWRSMWINSSFWGILGCRFRKLIGRRRLSGLKKFSIRSRSGWIILYSKRNSRIFWWRRGLRPRLRRSGSGS